MGNTVSFPSRLDVHPGRYGQPFFFLFLSSEHCVFLVRAAPRPRFSPFFDSKPLKLDSSGSFSLSTPNSHSCSQRLQGWCPAPPFFFFFFFFFSVMPVRLDTSYTFLPPSVVGKWIHKTVMDFISPTAARLVWGS